MKGHGLLGRVEAHIYVRLVYARRLRSRGHAEQVASSEWAVLQGRNLCMELEFVRAVAFGHIYLQEPFFLVYTEQLTTTWEAANVF